MRECVFGVWQEEGVRCYAVSDMTYHPNLAAVQYNVFFNLCRLKGVHFDLQAHAHTHTHPGTEKERERERGTNTQTHTGTNTSSKPLSKLSLRIKLMMMHNKRLQQAQTMIISR